MAFTKEADFEAVLIKILSEHDWEKEVQNLIDWVCLSEQIKENNNTVRNLTGKYKRIEPDCREGIIKWSIMILKR